MSQEDVIALLDRASQDGALRLRLQAAESPAALEQLARTSGFRVGAYAAPDVLSDADLEGLASAATNRTCHGTTDCCRTNRTCFGTTDCCR